MSNDYIYIPIPEFIEVTENTGVAVSHWDNWDGYHIYPYESCIGSSLMQGCCFSSELNCLTKLYEAIALCYDTGVNLLFPT